MKTKFIFFSLIVLLAGRTKAQFASSNFTLLSQSDPETTFNPDGQKYSGCWGWYQPEKNKEYAIACSHKGTYWIDVTNPATPTVSAYRAGKRSGCTWREAKSYRNYLYVVSDDFGNNSMQIFDMQYLPDSVHKVYDSNQLIVRGHTIWVDGDKLYVGSATSAVPTLTYSPMHVYSLANPVLPVLLRKLENDYPLITEVHDMFVRHDTIYASCAYQGLYVFKLTVSNTFTLLGSLTNYPFSGYNHSSALTPNGQTLVFMDEVPSGLPIKIANVSNLNNIQVLATINQFTNTTPHNPFMANNQYCFASSYQDGLQLFDISAPASPSLAGYFDTHPQSGGNNNTWPTGAEYNGQWGAYPYLPSGIIFALDRLNGAFFLKTSLYQAPLVTANFYLPAKACLGDKVNLVNSSSGANTFSWTFPSGVTATSTLGNASMIFNSTGTFTVSLLAANPASGSATVTHTITIINNNVSAAATSTANASCNTCSNGIALITPSGGTGPYTYKWFPYGGAAASSSVLTPGCYTITVSDAFSCSTFTTACVSFESGVSLTKLNNAAEAKIFPNPASGQISVSYTSGDASVLRLKNILGQVIFEKEFKGPVNELIDVRSLPNGTYIISITEDNSTYNKKLIIQH